MRLAPCFVREKTISMVGGTRSRKVDVRIIAATNVDLRKSVGEGKFREDLFYRLNVIPVQMPALRERKEDIPLLVQHFLDKHSEDSRKSGWFVTPEALDLLMVYDWPGNVRELENVIERAVVLCPSREIGVDLIPDQVRSNRESPESDFVVPPGGIPLREVLSNAERRWIESALEAAGGVQKKAAELLFIKPTTLNEMIKRYDIQPRRRRQDTEQVPPVARPDVPPEPE